MDSVTVKNFRCFREQQTARLAPLTLLVGENSTGKTSFLALLRALWDVAFREVVPDFREAPYDLGGFDEIAHHRGGRGGRADSFEAGFELQKGPGVNRQPQSFHALFKDHLGVPFPETRTLTGKEGQVEASAAENGQPVLRFRTSQVSREHLLDSGTGIYQDDEDLARFLPSLRASRFDFENDHLALDALIELDELARDFQRLSQREAPDAGAPVRSQPKRTYDPARPYWDPEGEYIPTYLAAMSRQDAKQWELLKMGLEDFGKKSGLFDEIEIASLGQSAGSPFQVRIRQYGKRSKGPDRNLIDVGYGVSQSLPLVTELVEQTPAPLSLLQQPEVHLHPRAQAALGTLFCSIAAPDRQLVVETHSDYVINRIRMDIRDQATALKPEDVSILFFEQKDLDVKIHSLRIDKQGNILGAPNGYRQFFSDELRRSVGV